MIESRIFISSNLQYKFIFKYLLVICIDIYIYNACIMKMRVVIIFSINNILEIKKRDTTKNIRKLIYNNLFQVSLLSIEHHRIIFSLI